MGVDGFYSFIVLITTFLPLVRLSSNCSHKENIYIGDTLKCICFYIFLANI